MSVGVHPGSGRSLHSHFQEEWVSQERQRAEAEYERARMEADAARLLRVKAEAEERNAWDRLYHCQSTPPRDFGSPPPGGRSSASIIQETREEEEHKIRLPVDQHRDTIRRETRDFIMQPSPPRARGGIV
eukprot:TRINITY_DN25388_c0_g1_i2.p3 TRINITY_DN25388_c0_g1~~TRINITY_DN25388_c0_g1_i2.p3  ORF type:complete len:130 (+),score=35.80 TRINITY_DN25388_c0_g1_i2:57-446(+)